MCQDVHQRLSQKGFSVLEVLVVITVVGILSAMVIPKFASARSEVAVAAVGEDILRLTSVIEGYHNEHGYWPTNSAAGVTPAEIRSKFRESPFEIGCPTGGMLDYENNQVGGVQVVSIEIRAGQAGEMTSMVDALAIDQYLDDGSLNTGRFQSSGASLSYRLSP